MAAGKRLDLGAVAAASISGQSLPSELALQRTTIASSQAAPKAPKLLHVSLVERLAAAAGEQPAPLGVTAAGRCVACNAVSVGAPKVPTPTSWRAANPALENHFTGGRSQIAGKYRRIETLVLGNPRARVRPFTRDSMMLAGDGAETPAMKQVVAGHNAVRSGRGPWRSINNGLPCGMVAAG